VCAEGERGKKGDDFPNTPTYYHNVTRNNVYVRSNSVAVIRCRTFFFFPVPIWPRVIFCYHANSLFSLCSRKRLIVPGIPCMTCLQFRLLRSIYHIRYVFLFDSY